MGQACMKSGEIDQNRTKSIKCKKCNNPMINNNHKCFQITQLENQKPILRKSNAILTINPASLLGFYGNGIIQAPGQMFNIKVFKTNQRTQSIWKKQPTWFFPITMKQKLPQIIKTRSFQQKLYWFRLNIETIRVSWEQGSQTINVDRSNILMSSKNQLQNINLKKQIKIVFNDQKVSDAGGLLRQYMHLALKQIFSPETGIFQLSQCTELAYRFKWDQSLVEEFVIQYMKVLGLIIGKALFQRISINCYLDRAILRQITGNSVHLEDLFTYDQSTYKSLSSILNETGASQIALNFCLYHQPPGTNDLKEIQLIPNGRNILVNDSNKQQYARLLIHHYCTLSCRKYLSVMRQYIYKVVPYSLISVFEPIQLQMILHGPSVIDLQDWKKNTNYKGYKQTDKQIVWFWYFLNQLPQQKLRHLLHYVTGTSRVPILGFKYLQSNRNQLVPFTLQKCQYDKNNPYPKSYTCFNRLQLPAYSSKQELNQKVKNVVENQLTHFGLD